jgi:hypothetical protein
VLQNRGPQHEAIIDLNGMLPLLAEPRSNVYPNAIFSADNGRPIKPKQKMTVTLDATYNLANDPAKKTSDIWQVLSVMQLMAKPTRIRGTRVIRACPCRAVWTTRQR